jgi:hypothetical protein
MSVTKKKSNRASPTARIQSTMTALDEDSIDEILYLARANEPAELATYVAGLASQTGAAQPALLQGAIDPHSKNSALHYAAANGHNGASASASAPVLLAGVCRLCVC